MSAFFLRNFQRKKLKKKYLKSEEKKSVFFVYIDELESIFFSNENCGKQVISVFGYEMSKIFSISLVIQLIYIGYMAYYTTHGALGSNLR